MPLYTLSPIVAVEASGPGALAGFESRCSCGLVLRSSLRTILEADRREHGAYHARKAGERAAELERNADLLRSSLLAPSMTERAMRDEAAELRALVEVA